MKVYKKPDVSKQHSTTISSRAESKTTKHKPNTTKLTPKQKTELVGISDSKRSKYPQYTVVGLRFDILRPDVLNKLSVGNVTSVVSSDITGVNSAKSGVVDDLSLCKTCGEVNLKCVGHVMKIPMPEKFVPAISLETVVKILRCVCACCSGIMVTELYLRELSKGNLMEYRGIERLKEIAKECIDSKLTCKRYTGNMQGKFSSINGRNVNYEECSRNKNYTIVNGAIHSTNSDSKKKGNKGLLDVEQMPDQMDMTTLENILKYISREDKVLMGFPENFDLKDFICDAIPCISINARPPNYYDGESRADQITHVYQGIVEQIQIYKETRNSELDYITKKETFAKICKMYNNMVHNKDESLKQAGKHQAVVSVKEKLGTKKGLVRANCMGKRTTYCGRFVGGPDSTLLFGEVGIPEIVKSELTIEETVTVMNLQTLTDCLEKGELKSIKFGPRRNRRFQGCEIKIWEDSKLFIGDIVRRHSKDGDVCLVGRQPTLHKEGLQGFRIRFIPGNTIRLHMGNTRAFNADFDGDELSMYLVQTIGSRVEAKYLANTESCIQDQQKSKTMVGLVYNALSSIYIMTQIERDEIILTPEEFEEAESILTYTKDLMTIEQRIRSHNRKYPDEAINILSGKALFSRLLPHDFNYDGKPTKKTIRELVNGQVVETSDIDVTVKIRNGVLIKGIINDSHISSAANSIVHHLWKDYGKVRTAAFITDGTFLADWFIFNYGFSVGINDFIGHNPGEISATVEKEINNTYESIFTLGKEKKNSTPEEKMYREQQIHGFTNNSSNIGKLIAKNNLFTNNSLNIMSESGAKGNAVNTAQITGLCGQQFNRRFRPIPTIDGGKRCLPYFPRNSKLLEARGMIRTSFYKGINPAAVFFHMIGTRENLVQIASSTPDVGALHRRICKVLESTHVAYDGSVRNCTGAIFQYMYADGFEPGCLLPIRTPEYGSLLSFINIENTVKNLNANIEIVLEREKNDKKQRRLKT